VPALDDSVITKAEVEREDTAAVGAGLDVLEEPDHTRDPWWRRLGSSIVPPVLALVVVLVIWEIVYLLELKPEVMLPSPAAVWTELLRLVEDGQAGETIWTSLSRGLFGFLMAIAIGAPIGLLIARFTWIRNSFGPLLTGLQSMPSVAWVPLAILWFQISPAMIYMVVLLGAVPSIANGLVPGSIRCRRCTPGWVMSLASAGGVRPGTSCCLPHYPDSWPGCGRAGRSPGAR